MNSLESAVYQVAETLHANDYERSTRILKILVYMKLEISQLAEDAMSHVKQANVLLKENDKHLSVPSLSLYTK